VVIDSVGDVIVGVEAPEHWDERVLGTFTPLAHIGTLRSGRG
jgi:hypothetical protein